MILVIETSGKFCSAAVCLLSGEVISFCKSDKPLSHAEEAPGLIEKALAGAGISPAELSAVAVNKGPGSYTGLRIGSSLAKGIVFATETVLIGVDGLQALVLQAVKQGIEADVYWAMIDARRDEVFAACYDRLGNILQPLRPMILTDQSENLPDALIKSAFCGDSAEKIRRLLPWSERAVFFDQLIDAEMMCTLAAKQFRDGQFADLAYFEPDYGKEFIAGITQKFRI